MTIFFDYIIFDFEIQFIITFYGSYDTLDKDRFAALDIRADFFLLALSIQQRHDGKVDDNVGQRVHQGGDVAHVELHFGQHVILCSNLNSRSNFLV